MGWGSDIDIHWPSDTEQTCSTPGGNFPTATPIALSPSDRTTANNIYDHWGQSISALEHTADVSPFSSKFDAFLAGKATLTPDEAAGYKLFDGKASCVLVGNMGSLVGGMEAFPDADPADGLLELGVVTAEGAVEWARVLTRLAVGSAERSPLTRMTRASDVDIRFDQPVRYELDGGDRPRTKKLRARVEPGAVIVAVPA